MKKAALVVIGVLGVIVLFSSYGIMPWVISKMEGIQHRQQTRGQALAEKAKTLGALSDCMVKANTDAEMQACKEKYGSAATGELVYKRFTVARLSVDLPGEPKRDSETEKLLLKSLAKAEFFSFDTGHKLQGDISHLRFKPGEKFTASDVITRAQNSIGHQLGVAEMPEVPIRPLKIAGFDESGYTTCSFSTQQPPIIALTFAGRNGQELYTFNLIDSAGNLGNEDIDRVLKSITFSR